MLKLVIALALVIGSVQCAAACTPVSHAMPACHHHKQAPPCAHELIPATIVQISVITVPLSAEPVHTPDANAQVFFPISTSQDPSPPGPLFPPRTILRI